MKWRSVRAKGVCGPGSRGVMTRGCCGLKRTWIWPVFWEDEGRMLDDRHGDNRKQVALWSCTYFLLLSARWIEVKLSVWALCMSRGFSWLLIPAIRWVLFLAVWWPLPLYPLGKFQEDSAVANNRWVKMGENVLWFYFAWTVAFGLIRWLLLINSFDNIFSSKEMSFSFQGQAKNVTLAY